MDTFKIVYNGTSMLSLNNSFAIDRHTLGESDRSAIFRREDSEKIQRLGDNLAATKVINLRGVIFQEDRDLGALRTTGESIRDAVVAAEKLQRTTIEGTYTVSNLLGGNVQFTRIDRYHLAVDIQLYPGKKQIDFVAAGGIAGELILCVEGTGEVKLLDADNGNTTWTNSDTASEQKKASYLSTARNKDIIVGGLNRIIRRLSFSTGSQIWATSAFGTTGHFAVTVDENDNIYVGDAAGSIWRLDPDTGAISWGPVAVHTDLVNDIRTHGTLGYSCSDDGDFTTWLLSNGTTQTDCNLGTADIRAIDVDPDNQAFVVIARGTRFRRYTISTCTQVWDEQTASANHNGAKISFEDSGSRFFFGTFTGASGKIEKRNLASGALVASDSLLNGQFCSVDAESVYVVSTGKTRKYNYALAQQWEINTGGEHIQPILHPFPTVR